VTSLKTDHCVGKFETGETLRISNGFTQNVFPGCARPIMQMCAVWSTSCALQASAYCISTNEACPVARTAQMVYKPPYFTFGRQTSVSDIVVLYAPNLL